MQATGDDFMIYLIDEVVLDLLKKLPVVSRLQHTSHIHRDGELLMGVDRLAR
jgi:hypothetical protein